MFQNNFPKTIIKQVNDEDIISRGLAIEYLKYSIGRSVCILNDKYIYEYIREKKNFLMVSKKLKNQNNKVCFEYTLDKNKNGTHRPWTDIFPNIKLKGYYIPKKIRREIEFIGYHSIYRQIAIYDGSKYIVPEFKYLNIHQLTKDQSFIYLYNKTKYPLLLVNSEDPEFRDINLSYTDRNNEYHTFGTYKNTISQFPTLKPFIKGRSLELPRGKCSEAIVKIILHTDGYTQIDFNNLNIGQCLELLCGLKYLQGDTRNTENKLAELLSKEDNLFEALYPHHKMIDYLRNQGLKLIIE